MKVILAHTLRSIKGSKWQIAIIIITIVIVTAMLFTALSITDLFFNLNVSNQSRLASDSNISISGELFPISKVDGYASKNNGIVRTEYFLQIGGLLHTEKSSKAVLLEATDLEQLWENHSKKLKVVRQTADFEYTPIWIGEDLAKELDLSEGDEVEIYLDFLLRLEKFSVACIMENTGFYADSLVDNILLDIGDINNQGLANIANIKLDENADYAETVAGLKAALKNEALDVKPAIDYQRAEQIMRDNSNLLNIALALIMAMMVLILFTSYLVIAKNRLNEMVIFKAAGATPVQTMLIMLLEVSLYGIAGASIGLALGRLGMGIAVKSIIPNFPNAVTFQAWKFILAFGLGLGVAVFSALIPIIKISKKSIRQLTSGAVKDIKYLSPVFLIITSVLIIAGVVTVIVLELAVVQLTLALILLFAVWIAGVVPYVAAFVSKLIGRIKPAYFASVSIKRNSASHVLSILVGSLITFTFFVYSVINLVVVAITPVNTRYNADFVVNSAVKTDFKELSDEISAMSGVKETSYYKTALFDAEVKGEKITYDLVGIDSFRALHYASEGLTDADYAAFNSTQKPIIINNDLALRLNLKVGDSFTASRERSRAETKYIETVDTVFTIVAIEYSKTENDRVAYVYESQMLSQGKPVEADNEKLFVISDGSVSTEKLFLSLRAKVESNAGVFVLKFSDWQFAATKGLEGVAALFRIIQILVSAVASIGIINLSIVTLFDRRKEFNIYRTCGMDAQKYSALTLFEGWLIGVSGSVIGIVLSFLINRLMSPFAKLINKFMSFSIFPIEILIVSSIGLVFYAILYWLIALGNSKFLRSPIVYNERML